MVMLPASSSLSAGSGNEWVLVNPASGLALAMDDGAGGATPLAR